MHYGMPQDLNLLLSLLESLLDIFILVEYQQSSHASLVLEIVIEQDAGQYSPGGRMPTRGTCRVLPGLSIYVFV